MKILFLGTVNSLPMMYANALKEAGHEVIYFVNFKRSNELHRPENHYHNISYPYDDWIVEMPSLSNHLISIFPIYYYLRVLFILRKIKFAPDIVFFNDTYISVAQYFDVNVKKVILPHGGDFESWCFEDNLVNLKKSMVKRSIYRFFPSMISRSLITKSSENMRKGLAVSNFLIHFPKEFSRDNKRKIEYYESNIGRYIPRYDISLSSLKYVKRKLVRKNNDKFRIICPVRFAYKTFPEGNEIYNKRNDLIIKAIDKFIEGKNIDDFEVVFYNKGVDLSNAKKMISSMNFLSKVVIFQDTKPLLELLDEMQKSNVVFDSVGPHWPGAIGVYSLYLDVPCIANFNIYTKAKLINDEMIPPYSADNVETIVECLNNIYRNRNNGIEEKPTNAIANCFGPEGVLDKLEDFLRLE